MNNHVHANAFVYKAKAHHRTLKIPCLYVRAMKLAAFLLLVFCVSATANVVAQKIDLQVENAPLKSVLMELTRKSGYNFVFRENEVAKAPAVSLSIKNKEITEILPILFADLPFT